MMDVSAEGSGYANKVRVCSACLLLMKAAWHAGVQIQGVFFPLRSRYSEDKSDGKS